MSDLRSVADNAICWSRREDLTAEAMLPAECVKTTTDLALGLRDVLPDDGREHLIAVALDCAGAPIAWHIVADGTVDSVPLHPRDVYAWALSIPCVRFVGVAHNHPTGNVSPSGPDESGTALVASLGAMLELPLAWSLVVSHRTDAWSAIGIKDRKGKARGGVKVGGDDGGNPPVPADETEDEDGDRGGSGESDGDSKGDGDSDEDRSDEDGKAEDEDEDADTEDEPADADGGTAGADDGATGAAGSASREDLARALDRLMGRKG